MTTVPTATAMPVMLPRLAHDVGRMLRKAATNPPPDADTDPDAWAWQALLVLCLPEVHQGLADSESLARVAALHNPAAWASEWICGLCRVAWPCATAQAFGHR
jgi:hypothetical protein